MCGYDPFYWYEKDLDDEYLERFKDDGIETINESGTRADDLRSGSRNDRQ